MTSAQRCWRKGSPKPKLSSSKEKPPDKPTLQLSNETLDNLNRLIYLILINYGLLFATSICLELEMKLQLVVLDSVDVCWIWLFGSDGEM